MWSWHFQANLTTAGRGRCQALRQQQRCSLNKFSAILPFLERPQSSANFLWSSSQQEMAEEKTLTAEARPAVPRRKKKGEVIPAGCQGAGSSRKEQGSHPPLEQHPTESHMLTCLFFFFFVENTMVPPSHCCASGGWKRSRLLQRTAARRALHQCWGSSGITLGFQMLGNR